MGLERHSIEKKNFPVGERGYAPEAVDAHLAAVAAEVEDLKRTAGTRTETLASSASERVHAIIAAAETTAAEIQRAAEEDARMIRDQADHEAHGAREQAAEQAREYLGRVSEATNAMMQRLGGMEHELTGLVDSLRTGSGRLRSDIDQLESDLARVREGIVPPPGRESAAGMAPQRNGAAEPPGQQAGSPEPVPEAAELSSVVGAGEPAGRRPSAVGTAPASGDAEGARLIALNMALNGTSREETARYLSDNFQLEDAGGLLDEVYASVEG